MLETALKYSDVYQAAIEKWNIGTGYAYKGFNETALDYYFDALAFFEQADYLEDLGGIYNQIHNHLCPNGEVSGSDSLWRKSAFAFQ